MYERKHVASPWCVYERKDVADGCMNGNKYVASPRCEVAASCMNGNM